MLTEDRRSKPKVAIIRGTSLNPWEARCFQMLNQDFTVAGITSWGNKYDLSQTSLPIKRLFCPGEILGGFPGYIPFLYSLYGSPQILINLEEVISGYDLVEGAEIFNYYTFQVVEAKKKGLIKKVGLTVWENLLFNNETTAKTQAISDYVISNADFFIAGTKSAYQSMLLRGIDQKKIVATIPMSEDTDFFKKVEHQEEKKQDFIFLCASRLVFEKGVQDAILALKYLLDKNYHAKLWVVGEGNYEKDLISLCSKLSLNDKVIFLPPVPYFSLPNLYNKVDAFILPSLPSPNWQEQFGMTILQAMACEVPVIGSRSGSIPELISDCGLLYDPSDIHALEGHMGKLIKDKKLYLKLAKSGRERVKNLYDYRVVAKQRINLYKKLLNLL